LILYVKPNCIKLSHITLDWKRKLDDKLFPDQNSVPRFKTVTCGKHSMKYLGLTLMAPHTLGHKKCKHFN